MFQQAVAQPVADGSQLLRKVLKYIMTSSKAVENQQLQIMGASFSIEIQCAVFRFKLEHALDTYWADDAVMYIGSDVPYRLQMMSVLIAALNVATSVQKFFPRLKDTHIFDDVPALEAFQFKVAARAEQVMRDEVFALSERVLKEYASNLLMESERKLYGLLTMKWNMGAVTARMHLDDLIALSEVQDVLRKVPFNSELIGEHFFGVCFVPPVKRFSEQYPKLFESSTVKFKILRDEQDVSNIGDSCTDNSVLLVIILRAEIDCCGLLALDFRRRSVTVENEIPSCLYCVHGKGNHQQCVDLAKLAASILMISEAVKMIPAVIGEEVTGASFSTREIIVENALPAPSGATIFAFLATSFSIDDIQPIYFVTDEQIKTAEQQIVQRRNAFLDAFQEAWKDTCEDDRMNIKCIQRAINLLTSVEEAFSFSKLQAMPCRSKFYRDKLSEAATLVALLGARIDSLEKHLVPESEAEKQSLLQELMRIQSRGNLGAISESIVIRICRSPTLTATLQILHISNCLVSILTTDISQLLRKHESLDVNSFYKYFWECIDLWLEAGHALVNLQKSSASANINIDTAVEELTRPLQKLQDLFKVFHLTPTWLIFEHIQQLQNTCARALPEKPQSISNESRSSSVKRIIAEKCDDKFSETLKTLNHLKLRSIAQRLPRSFCASLSQFITRANDRHRQSIQGLTDKDESRYLTEAETNRLTKAGAAFTQGY
jgi:hypothetical protein